MRGATIELFVSKTLFPGADRVEWDADAVWWGREEHDRAFDHLDEVGTARVDRTDLDLGALAGTVNGNVFEVFHYPVFPKNIDHVTSYIYEQIPANDEIAVLFTDFRIDDLFGHGPSTGPVNVPVQGIGDSSSRPRSGEDYGSQSLLVSMAPQFIGGENSMEGNRPGRQRPPVPQLCGRSLVDRARSHAPVARAHAVPESPLRTDRDFARVTTVVIGADFLHAPAVLSRVAGFFG